MCKVLPILSCLQCVNSLSPSDTYMHHQASHHCFRKWLVTLPAPYHYLNQCWNIVNWTIRMKLHHKCYQTLYIFIQENVSKYIIWTMATLLSQPQCVKKIDYLVTCGIIKVSPCIQAVDDYVDWQLASSVCSQGFQGIVDVAFQYPWVTNIYSTNGSDQPLCTYRALWKPLWLQE